ncbi:MAG: hypothetical protein M1832_000988 [Thelocarpon impressellum]|nr:MAG: hypothetical protein M1832_000988 [Thelocarpon impressellum]
MRYKNWDVLLFAEDSKVPIQDFKAMCHVLQDPESAQLQAGVTQNLPFPIDHVIPLQLPTVVGFVASLPEGSPFRISIHSWEAPEWTDATVNLLTVDDKVAYEARIIVDGRVLAYTLFSDQGPWPQVINWIRIPDKNGNPQTLKFPPFYEEVLANNWWGAAETLGRIKVVIAEGIARPAQGYPFERVKNLVAFSFQHAPLDTLETSGIAWPNPSMWLQITANPFTMPKGRVQVGDADAHAHSPRRRDSQRLGSSNSVPPPIPPRPRLAEGVTLGRHDYERQLACYRANSCSRNGVDLFYHGYALPEHQQHRSFSARLGSADQLMPDYSSMSGTTASSRSATAVLTRWGHRQPGQALTPRDVLMGGQIDLLDQRSGTFNGPPAPSNTRASSAESTPVNPPPSAAAQARTASYSAQARRLSIQVPVRISASMRIPVRAGSDASMSSRFSDEVAAQKENIQLRIRKTPAAQIKGKKEGAASKEQKPTASASRATSGFGSRPVQEGAVKTPQAFSSIHVSKRKRSQRVPSQQSVDAGALAAHGGSSSPTRKVSKNTASGSPQVHEVVELAGEGPGLEPARLSVAFLEGGQD